MNTVEVAPVAVHSITSPFGIASSPDISQLAEAMSAFQAKVANPPKSKEATITPRGGGSAYTYRYVDFADGLEAIRPVLAAEGLSFMQLPQLDGGDMNVVTRVMHRSGQWIESVYPVGPIGDHRTMGGALTYARRYSLFATLGIAGEDDLDGAPEATAAPTGAGRGTRKAEPPQVRGRQQAQLPPPEDQPVALLSVDDSKRAAGVMLETLAQCASREDELEWAKTNQAIKASLQPNDSKEVTAAFNAHGRARRESEGAAKEPAK